MKLYHKKTENGPSVLPTPLFNVHMELTLESDGEWVKLTPDERVRIIAERYEAVEWPKGYFAEPESSPKKKKVQPEEKSIEPSPEPDIKSSRPKLYIVEDD
jgi:hypothetical protein